MASAGGAGSEVELQAQKIDILGQELIKADAKYQEVAETNRNQNALLEELQNKEAVDKFSSPLSGKNLPFSSLSEKLDDKKKKKDSE